MEMTLCGIDPIPVEYVLAIAQTKGTDAKRRPYIELIERWGEEQGKEEEARQLLKRLREGQVLDPKKMPREFMPRYRQPEIAEKLIEIVRKIDDIITSKSENWTWAHVMRVMVDEGILYKPSYNRFDAIICSMIPGKGRVPSRTSIPHLPPSVPSATRSPSSSPPSSPAKSAPSSD